MAEIKSAISVDQVVFIASGGAGNAPSTQGATFVFDVVQKASISKESEASSHPIEGSSNISDHVWKKNTVINFDLIVTDYPIKDPSDSGFLGSNIRDFKTPVLSIDREGNTTFVESASGTQNYRRENRAWEAYQKLSAIHSAGGLVTVVTRYDSFPNCTIKSLENVEDKRDAYIATISLEQLRIIDSLKTTTFTSIVIPPTNAGDARKGEQLELISSVTGTPTVGKLSADGYTPENIKGINR